MDKTQKFNGNMAVSHEGIYSFSEPSSQIFISNYLDKIVWAFILFIFAYAFIKVGRLSLHGIVLFLLLCAFPYSFGRIQHKFANKIILDFNKHKAAFHMNRGEPVIEAHFDDIKTIFVNGYIIFNLNEKKVLYANSQNKELLKSLNKISRISWGFLCNLWGPTKKIRDEIDKEVP